jgi:hypothetical protein
MTDVFWTKRGAPPQWEGSMLQRAAGIVAEEVDTNLRAGRGGKLTVIEAVNTGRDVANLRSYLADQMVPGGMHEGSIIIEKLEYAAARPDIDPNEVEHVRSIIEGGRMQAAWVRHSLDEAHLWWVSGELVEVVVDATETIPDDITTDDVMPPHPYGFVVLDRPVQSVTIENETCWVDALSWGPVTLPDKDDSGGPTREAVGVNAFRRVSTTRIPYEDDDRLGQSFRGEGAHPGLDDGHEMWLSVGRSDWPLHTTITSRSMSEAILPDFAHETIVKDRRFVAALWAAMGQQAVTERTQVYPPRQALRRLQRAQGGRSVPPVTCVHLRGGATVDDERPVTHEGTGRHVSVRFLVRSHFRNQAYGPNRSLRRLTLVPAHIRGPAGAPFVKHERVYLLDEAE